MAALALDHPIGLDGGSAGVPVPHSSDRRRLESGKRGLIDKYDPGRVRLAVVNLDEASRQDGRPNAGIR